MIHLLLLLGGLCRHGGTSVPALSGEHMFCLCTVGYGGKHCELGKKHSFTFGHLTITVPLTLWIDGGEETFSC